MNNNSEYKGIYYKTSKDQKTYEGGAHFKYKDLYFLLMKLKRTFDLNNKKNQLSLPKEENNKLSINKPQKTRNKYNTIEKTSRKHFKCLSIKTNNFFLDNIINSKNNTTSSAIRKVIQYSNENRDRKIIYNMKTMPSHRTNSKKDPERIHTINCNNINSSTNYKKCLYIKVNEKLNNNSTKEMNLTNKNTLIHSKRKADLNIHIDNSLFTQTILNTVTEPHKSIEFKKDKKDDAHYSQEYVSTNTKSNYSTKPKAKPKENKSKRSVGNKAQYNNQKQNNRKIFCMSKLNEDKAKKLELIYNQIMIKFNNMNTHQKKVKRLWSFDKGT